MTVSAGNGEFAFHILEKCVVTIHSGSHGVISLYFFGNPELCTTGTGIVFELLVRWQDGFFSQDSKFWLVSADTNGEVSWTGASACVCIVALFNDAVLE